MNSHTVQRHVPWLLVSLLLVACASPVPQAIRQAPPDNPSLAAVRTDATGHLGRQLRWGGTIIETQNQKDATWLTVLGQPLTTSGRPGFDDDSEGRFIAIVPGFLDPKVYAPDRWITVTGTLLRTLDGLVGDFPYTYPVVEADAWYLWPVKSGWPYYHPDPWWRGSGDYRYGYHDPRYPCCPPYGY